MNNPIQPKTTRLPLFYGERFLDLNPDMLLLVRLLQQSSFFWWKNKGFNSVSENCLAKWGYFMNESSDSGACLDIKIFLFHGNLNNVFFCFNEIGTPLLSNQLERVTGAVTKA